MSLSDEIDRIERRLESSLGPARAPSYSERIEDNLAVIGRILEKLERLGKMQDQKDRQLLEQVEKDLIRLKSVTNTAELDRVEADFWSLVLAHPDLQRIYMAFTEEDIITVLVEKLESVEELSKQRPLSDDELRIMQEIKKQLQKSRDALSEYTS